MRPFIIPIFIPHGGCRHRCVFCNQVSITGQRETALEPSRVRREIQRFLGHKKGPRAPVQISFYGGNFLGLSENRIRCLLDVAAEFVASRTVDSLRFSTRPDTIDGERLGWLADYPVDTIEIGAQSLHDRVLRASNRGHTARHTETAMRLLKSKGYETGLQLMLGLPGDSGAGVLDTGRRALALGPDFVRLYPVVVLKDSALADQFTTGLYKPLPLDTAVALTAQLYRLFVTGGVRVVRMGLQASVDLTPDSTILAGPFHPAFGQLVITSLFFNSVRRELARVDNPGHTISIAVNPRSVSNLRGQKNSTVNSLKRLYTTNTIRVISDPEIAETAVAVNQRRPVSILTGAAVQ